MKVENSIDAFAPATSAPPQSLWKFLVWSLRGAWPVLFVAAFFSAAAGTLEVFTAYFLGLVIDSAASTDPILYFQQNWGLLVGFVAFFLLFRPIVFGLSAGSNAMIVQPNTFPLVLSRLNRWTLGQTVTFFDNDFAGRIAQKQMQTARAITSVVSELINVGAFAVATLIGSSIFLFTIDVRIGAALLVWCVVYVAVMRWFLPRIRLRSADRAGKRAMVTGQIVDTITNIKTVKLFAHAKHEDQEALNAMRHLRLSAVQFGKLSTFFRFCLMTIAGTLPILLIGGTIVLWRNGGASLGDIAAAGSVSIRLGQMTGWVSFTLMAIYADIGEVEDGMKTLSPSIELVDAEDATTLDVPKGEIKFENVGFAYGRDIGGITNVNLTIHPHEKVGIVGASGAGKSTFVSLLLRLYDSETGQITIDDQNVSKVTQESLRQNIGMVTQETAMFNRSARDNILYGRPDATNDELIDAAKRAEAHEFINDLADHKGRTGYDAHLGERGVKLSGGQRQRIALARAILKDAPILVLDEATSALDSEVEASIQQSLENVMDGKTVLAIAHRLSTISQMDRIIVLDHGRVAEDGTHDELLKLNGLYAKYWERQSGGFIRTEDA